MTKTKANGLSLCYKNKQLNFEKVVEKLNREYDRTDECALYLAYQIAKQYSTCRLCGVGKGVGSVFVRDGNIICFGYNGVSESIKPCTEDTCIRVVQNIPVHTNRDICYGDCAEKRAIANAVRHNVNLAGSTVYITKSPCISCTKLLIDVGVKRVVYHKVYSNPDFPFQLLDMANVERSEFDTPRLSALKREEF